MTMSSPFWVRLLIPNGEQPEGLRIIEKSDWIGQGLIFPRSLFSEVRRERGEELDRPGVYLLWDPGAREMPSAYVGESDVLRSRLGNHERETNFWTHGIAFTSKDGSLHKAHVRYLEARLIELAKDAKRCELVGVQKPDPAKRPLSEAARVTAESYLENMRLCLSAIGIRFFEKPRRREGSPELFLNARGITADGYETPEGFLVCEGSQAAKDETRSVSRGAHTMRRKLLEKSIFEDAGDTFRLAQDYLFTSPSAAAGALLGRRASGPLQWKDADGRSLKDLRARVL